MFGNYNSNNLFKNIGYGENCTSTETITNIKLLNVSSVYDMGYMFRNTGVTAMTILDLGTNFDTSNVRSMTYMLSLIHI